MKISLKTSLLAATVLAAFSLPVLAEDTAALPRIVPTQQPMHQDMREVQKDQPSLSKDHQTRALVEHHHMKHQVQKDKHSVRKHRHELRKHRREMMKHHQEHDAGAAK